MVSRKRNKGKERKAKKEEKKRAEVNIWPWQGWARGEDKNGVKLIECDHGCAITTLLTEPTHPVSNFINDLFAVATGGNWINKVNFQSDYKVILHSQVWENEDDRKMTIKILLSIGTNLLLVLGINSTSHMRALAAVTVLALENYDGDMLGAMLTRVVRIKRRDLGGGNMRDVLKFFSKRTTCSCLKKMYSEARKTMPKQGKCFHCEKEMERSLLSVCSVCRIDQYCSRECQVAHWPTHQGYCDAYVKLHQKFDSMQGELALSVSG